jgi:hypothetical protein
MTDLRVVKRIAGQEFSLVAPPSGHSRVKSLEGEE